jgi:hypothetical protein
LRGCHAGRCLIHVDNQSEEATMSIERPRDDEGRAAPPHDDDADEPLGPMTPDDETALGDSPEAHDEISPHDLPPDHPGREEAERCADGESGTTKGNR